MTPTAAVDAPYELPGAREVVGRGFELMLAATGQLRRVSLYFGGLFVAFLGPLILLGVVMVLTAPPQVRDLADLIEAGGRTSGVTPIRDTGWVGAFVLLALGIYVGLAGVGLVAVEGGIVGIVLLAGHRLRRPITLRQALIRSRQVFWRVVRASFLLGLITGVVQVATGLVVAAVRLPDDGVTVVTLLASTLAATPFTFAQTGVVLGDVGAREAIRRSVSLFRARPRTALVIALFPAVFGGVIQLWALSAGGEVLILVGQATGLGIGSDAVHTTLTVVVLLAAAAATGSLFFTLGALFAAPQVVAFLGLTHYAGGLDRAIAAAPAAPSSMAAPTTPTATTPAMSGPVGAVPPTSSPLLLDAYAGPPRLSLRGRVVPPVLTRRPRFTRPADIAADPSTAPSAWVLPARDPGAGFHWVTRGMALAIIAGVLLSVAGIASLASRLGQS